MSKDKQWLSEFKQYIEEYGGTCDITPLHYKIGKKIYQYLMIYIYGLKKDIGFVKLLQQCDCDKLWLSIHNCYFKNFPNEILDLTNLYDLNLIYLYGDDNKFLPFPHNFALPNLRSLTLEDLGLDVFDMTWLNCPELEVLKLIHMFNTTYYNNNYFNLNFSHLDRLEELLISNNNIRILNDIEDLRSNYRCKIKNIIIRDNKFILQKDNNELSYKLNNNTIYLPILSKVIRKLGVNFTYESLETE